MLKAAVAAAGAAVLTLAAAQVAEPLQPLPADAKLDARKVALGSKLFRDTRLARDNSVSCLSCHSFGHGGADPRPRSVGAGGKVGAANSPSIFNAGHNFRQLWNGSIGSLEEQVDKVVQSPAVFDSKWDDVLAKLRADAALTAQAQAAYPDEGLTRRTVAEAIATYERSLARPSRFDRWLRGDAGAIDAQELLGYQKFKAYGCVACHQGVNVGGNMYQRFGALSDYFKSRAAAGQPLTDADRGRFNVTQDAADLHVFKVPSLRNVALTAPYFHDGAAQTLEQAVDVMFRVQLGRTAPPQDKALIIGFLRTLSGETTPAK